MKCGPKRSKAALFQILPVIGVSDGNKQAGPFLEAFAI